MKTFRKGRLNLFILLLYLVTLQVSTGSAVYSIYLSVAAGITYIKEKPSRSNPKYFIVLRKHLNNAANSEKSSASAAVITSSYTFAELNVFEYLKTTRLLIPQRLYICGKLKNRAPPIQIS